MSLASMPGPRAILTLQKTLLGFQKYATSVQSLRNSSSAVKVTLVGASGGIGQPLALLLKKNVSIAHLALYDIVGTPGVCADLSHINTPAKVTAHMGPNELSAALKDADVVVVPAGVPRKPGMTRDDLFNTNAAIVRDVAEAAAKACPNAFLSIITNPVNSNLPIASEVYKNNGCYDPKKIFGVTLLDVVRAQTFVSELKNVDVTKTKIPVVGGHSGVTIVPLLSQCQPKVQLSDGEIKALSERIQEAGTEVVKAKAGAVSLDLFNGTCGSATLSMALAAEYFVGSLVNALKGQKSVQCAYVRSDVVQGLDYFAGPVELGPKGVEKILPLGELSSYEKQLVEKAIPDLKKEIAKGTSKMSKASRKVVDDLAHLLKDVASKEIKSKYATDYYEEYAKLMKNHYNNRKRREATVPEPTYEKLFSKKNSTKSIIFNKVDQLEERQLPYWRQLDNAKMELLDRGLGPRNILEEQIEWTKKGKMWPYPIDNEYLLGEEDNVSFREHKVSFVDHVFLEAELSKHKFPRSEAIDHYMELVLTGLSKNPYMSVEKKHEHIRWFADYFKGAAEGKISCKNDELSHDVGNVSRSEVCSGPSPPYGQRIINGQHYEPLPTFPVTSHQQFGHQQIGNYQFQQSLMSNYYQQFPQLWYQQAVQLQLNYNPDLSSQVNGQSLRNLSNQRHIADKQFYNGL
uniref:Malate dehydrogenase, mitochondrial n=1 Tax=Meloidogyne floridensis TaxID=298350 RepID=A0A915NZN7_9BILA